MGCHLRKICRSLFVKWLLTSLRKTDRRGLSWIPVGTASVPNERRNVPQDGGEDVIITTDMSNDNVRNESLRAANAIEALRRSAPDREAGLEARSELLNPPKHRRAEPVASAEEP